MLSILYLTNISHDVVIFTTAWILSTLIKTIHLSSTGASPPILLLSLVSYREIILSARHQPSPPIHSSIEKCICTTELVTKCNLQSSHTKTRRHNPLAPKIPSQAYSFYSACILILSILIFSEWSLSLTITSAFWNWEGTLQSYRTIFFCNSAGREVHY
jgi:hypothetical protein